MTSVKSARPGGDAKVVADDGSITISLGDVSLQRGEVLEEARLLVKAWGRLNDARDNAVIIPTSFGSRHSDFEWMIGADALFDPKRYFIVVANLFGNGLSSSPGNSKLFEREGRFPLITAMDNALVQKFVLDRFFGVRRIAMAAGWSMGGQVAYHIASLFPDDVERLVPICASAKTAQHNLVFLEGARAVLAADCAYDRERGWFTRPPERALGALARFYAGWALSQRFYREELWRGLGYESLDAFVVGYWEKAFAAKDPNNLLSQIETWRSADIAANAVHGGDLRRALGAIRAQTLVMPCDSDLYFPVEDSELEVAAIPGARLCPISSAWGHRAGNPVLDDVARGFIKAHVSALLEGERRSPTQCLT